MITVYALPLQITCQSHQLLYTSLFVDSRIVNIERFGDGEGGVVGAVKQATFARHEQLFMAIQVSGRADCWSEEERGRTAVSGRPG